MVLKIEGTSAPVTTGLNRLDEKIGTLIDRKNYRYFRYNIEQFCVSLAKIINEVKSRDQFIAITKNDLIFRRSLIESHDFGLHFINHLLLPIIKTSMRLNVFDDASRIARKCIFTKNKSVFETNIMDPKESDESANIFTTLLNFLISLYPSQNNECATGYQIILSALQHSYSNFKFIYKFYMILLELIGFNLGLNTLEIVSSVPEFNLDISLDILNKIIDILMKRNINTKSDIEKLTFEEFHKNLALSVMSCGATANSCLIVSKIIEIDPLMAVTLIEDIVLCFMMNNDGNAVKEYEQLMINIMEIYRKLHGIQNFIAKFMTVLKSTLSDEPDRSIEPVYKFKGHTETLSNSEKLLDVEIIFSLPILKCFTDCVTTLTSWKLMNLFKTLLHHLSATVKELSELQNVDEKHFKQIEIVSVLTSWFLSSARMFDNKIAFAIIEKFVVGLEDLRNILSEFGTILLHRKHDQVLMKSFLNICYYWGEVYITLSYYANSETIKIKTIQTNDYSACNFTFVHSYLSEKEWCMIAERITNFSKGPCKDIVLQLIVQKFKASIMLEQGVKEEMIAPVVQYLSANINDISIKHLKDNFIMNNILPKLPTHTLLELSTSVLKGTMENKIDMKEFLLKQDPQLLITKGIINCIFTNINALLVQKRKLGDGIAKKSILAKTFLPSDLFMTDSNENMLRKASKTLCSESSKTLDIKMQDEKIANYLNVLDNCPIIFCTKEIQQCVIILLLALFKDCHKNKCDQAIQKIETLIIGIEQHSNTNLLELFEAHDLIEMVVAFNRYERCFEIITQIIFKTPSSVKSFRSGLELLVRNFDDKKYLKCGIATFKILKISKRNKFLTQDSKDICSEYMKTISDKFIEITTNKSPEDDLIEPFALVLKQDPNSAELKSSLEKYTNYVLENLNGNNIKGALILFAVILNRDKSQLQFEDNFEIKIWNSLNQCPLVQLDKEECSKIISYIVTHIEKEEMMKMLNDLEDSTNKSFGALNGEGLLKYLKIWLCIFETPLNSEKTEILQHHLQLLVEKISTIIQQKQFNEKVIEGAVNFEITLVQKNHFPVTFVMIDLFLFTVTLLMTKKDSFTTCYHLSMNLMENLLKHRNVIIMDRLPTFLLQYQFLLKELCAQSNSDKKLSPLELKVISDFAHRLEILTKNLAAHQKDMARIAYYVIENILLQFESVTLYPSVKLHLENCIYSLFPLCDQHAIQYLVRILSEASTGIFKNMFENYKRHHKFTGKI